MNEFEKWLNEATIRQANKLVDEKQPNLNNEQRDAMITIISTVLSEMINNILFIK